MATKNLLLLLALALFLESEAKTEISGLTNICRKTDHFEECVATLGPLLKGHNQVNAMAALKAGIQIADEKFKQAKQIVDHLAVVANNKMTKQCLSVCSENFDSAIDSLQNSLKAINRRDLGTLSSELSAIITYVETCNDAFDEVGEKSPVSVALSLLEKLGSNCMAIADQVDL